MQRDIKEVLLLFFAAIIDPYGLAEEKRPTMNPSSNRKSTRFVRTGILDGDTLQYEMMHFKRFENGKISEIWEYGDSRQVETVIE